MDSHHTVTCMITLNCWMAFIDLKDAYYSVPIQPAYNIHDFNLLASYTNTQHFLMGLRPVHENSQNC